MPLTPKQIGKLLKKNGFTIVVQGSNHTKYINPITNKTIPVPRHAKELGKGIERAILREAGIQK